MTQSAFTLEELKSLTVEQLKTLAKYLGTNGKTKPELIQKIHEKMMESQVEATPDGVSREEVKYSARLQRLMDIRKEGKDV